MRILLLLAALLLCAALHSASAEGDAVLRGTVRDASTGEPIPAAIIRLLESSRGTARGTIANDAGEFLLTLPAGTHQIAVSSVGYRTITLTVTLPGTAAADVRLVPSPVVLPEIVVTSEDPARAIMRGVIERKHRRAERLETYTFAAFTRQTIRRDTAIAAISESFTRGYWQRGDTMREIILQKRQTSNLPAAQNFTSVGRILNFYDDRIRFIGFSFVGPAATDAFDFYDFRLLRTRAGGAEQIAEIEAIPLSRTTPLFRGTLSVAMDSYAIAAIEVEPNEAFIIPFVKERRLRYRQQFTEVEKEQWMPVDIRIDGAFTVGIAAISLPRFGIEHTSVITDYQVNVPLPDSIFGKPRLTVDTVAARYDSSFWASTAVLPLDPEERSAYATLDSTKTLEIQFRPGIATLSLGGDAGAAGTLLQYLDAGFNRVEGFRLGLHADREVTPWLSLRGTIAYPFSARQGVYAFGATLTPLGNRLLSIGGEVYRHTDHRPDGGYYAPLFNSLTSLIAKNDYRDYYRASGWQISISSAPVSFLRGGLTFIDELQESMEKRTDFSLLYPSQLSRQNPPVTEGNLRALRLDLRLGPEPIPFDLVTTTALDLSVERSDPAFASSAFDYLRAVAVGTLLIPTAGEGFLLRPGFRVRVVAGGSHGTLPPQRWFDVESRSSGYAPFGVMRSAGVKEFSGTGIFAWSVEHNFRSIPFLLLGIPFLYEPGIEFILHGAGARSWASGNVPNTTPGWHAEAGFGISRIFDLFRVDATWRLTGARSCVISVGLASIF